MMKLYEYFLLSWKKMGIIILAWFLAVALHNIISGMLNINEPVFFIIAIIFIPLYLLIMIIYTLVNKIIHSGRRLIKEGKK